MGQLGGMARLARDGEGGGVNRLPAWSDHRRLLLVSAIDNLVKGAAGQAIQCANLMYGFDETAGLPCEGVYP